MDVASAQPTDPDDVESIFRRVGLEPPVYRPGDVEARTHIGRERALRWWRAMGFPEVDEDVAGFGESDVEVARQIGALIADGTVDEAGVLRLARLLGSSFSRIAEAQLSAIDPRVLQGLLNGDLHESPDETLTRLATLESSMLYVWRRHLLAALGQRMVATSDVEQAVGFADISAFTRLTKRLAPSDLAELVDHFEGLAFDLVSERGGRVVKLIGDEVMFVVNDPAEAARIGLDLIDAAAAGPRPVKLHCGIAFGATVDVGGDVFGSTVNLASRLTTVARPCTVVVPRDLGKRLASEADLSIHPSRQQHDLKGIGNIRIAAVRRAAAADPVETSNP